MQIFGDKPIAVDAIPQPMGAYSRVGAYLTKVILGLELIKDEGRGLFEGEGLFVDMWG